MGCDVPPEIDEKKPRKKSKKASGEGKRPRPRPGAAPPPLSALLDHLINIDAPCSVEQRNPKLPGSRVHALYERYRSATTIKEMLRLGARRAAGGFWQEDRFKLFVDTRFATAMQKGHRQQNIWTRRPTT